MPCKKTSINLTPENWKKVQQLTKTTSRSQSDIINQAIAGIPIISLGSQKTIAECFFDLRRFAELDDYAHFREEAEKTCQSLNLLMEKIKDLTPSHKE